MWSAWTHHPSLHHFRRFSASLLGDLGVYPVLALTAIGQWTPRGDSLKPEETKAPHQTAIFCQLRRRQMWRWMWTERIKRVMSCWRRGAGSWTHQCDINWILRVGGPVHVNTSETGPSLSKAQQLPLFHPNNGFSYTVEIIRIFKSLSFINKLLMGLNSQVRLTRTWQCVTHLGVHIKRYVPCVPLPDALRLIVWKQQFKLFKWEKQHCFTPCYTLTIQICSLFWGVEPIPAPVIGWEAWIHQGKVIKYECKHLNSLNCM